MDQTQSQTQNVLAERSPNTTSPTKAFGKFGAVEKMDLGSKGSLQYQQYISPSDALQSPTTKKLSDLKAKKINGGMNKPGKSLFKGIVGRRELLLEKEQQQQQQQQSQQQQQ